MIELAMIVVSSAKERICDGVEVWISYIYTCIRISKGPRIDPSGTPVWIFDMGEFMLSMETYCVLLVR